MWESIVFSFICFQLGNKVDEMSWLGEELKSLSINQVAKFVFNLNYQLNC